MRIVIVGSGLIGITTAYFLRRCGHEVMVIDREAGPGRVTSFANGGLLTPSMPEPWNAPGVWRVLLGSIGRSDSAMQLRLQALPGLARWGLRFLRNSSVTAYERNTLANLHMARYSLEVLRELRKETGVGDDHVALGTLRAFRDEARLEQACAAALRLQAHGLAFHRLSRAQATELEPALLPISDQLVGALHYDSDETGDAHRFCTKLAALAAQQGIEFRYATEISSIQIGSSAVAHLIAGGERITADRYIVAAGSYSKPLLRRIGIHLPIYPAKGYSVTVGHEHNTSSLRIPVVDDDLHAAVVPLSGAIRVAGTAEFAGYDRTLRPERIANLLKLMQMILPQMSFSPAAAQPWCGLRPMSADGVPIIGATPVANLLVNTGHGHLGWTMAAGSGHLLADLVSGNPTRIDATPYALARY